MSKQHFERVWLLPGVLIVVVFVIGIRVLRVESGGGWDLFLPMIGKPVEPRSMSDRPDDVDRYQIHVIYAIPSDGVDREFDITGDLANSVAAFNRWLFEQTGGSQLRVDTFEGEVDTTFVRLGQTDAEYRATDPFIRTVIDDELREMGFTHPRKIYAVYYDGSSDWSCGGGAWPPELFGQVAALYLRGLPNEPIPCDTNTFAENEEDLGYFEAAMLHEIMHTLGFNAPCGTSHHSRGHTSDGASDLMWSGPQFWDIANMEIDIGRNDYYQHNIPNCPDFANSVFLEPLPANAELPPGWSE